MAWSTILRLLKNLINSIATNYQTLDSSTTTSLWSHYNTTAILFRQTPSTVVFVFFRNFTVVNTVISRCAHAPGVVTAFFIVSSLAFPRELLSQFCFIYFFFGGGATVAEEIRFFPSTFRWFLPSTTWPTVAYIDAIVLNKHP